MLTCKRISEEEALAGINPTQAPSGYVQARWARGMPHGQRESKSMGWYQGRLTGQIDAILTLQEMGHTCIAAKLQRHYGIEDDGSIILA